MTAIEVRSLVNNLPGKANVHEKLDKRREVELQGASGKPYAAMLIKHTFIDIPIKNFSLSSEASRPVTFP